MMDKCKPAYFKSSAYVSSWFPLLILIICITPTVSGYDMEGSRTSFAKYPTWDPCQNGSVVFDFRTKMEHGVLLYADDGGIYDFIEVKLVGGMARLRLNLGSGTVVITAGEWSILFSFPMSVVRSVNYN